MPQPKRGKKPAAGTAATGDLFTPYEAGLQRLLDRLGPAHPSYAEALVYQQRLQENINGARRYGDTAGRQSQRAEILDPLNQLALAALGLSFNALAGPVPAPPDAMAIGVAGVCTATQWACAKSQWDCGRSQWDYGRSQRNSGKYQLASEKSPL